MIDIIGTLSELGIDFKSDGKNVGANDINVDCPFCEHEKHLGISKTGAVNCWVCEFTDLDRRPSLPYILSRLCGLPMSEIKGVLKEYGWEEDARFSKAADSQPDKCFIPNTYEIKPGSKAYTYLKSRGFGQETIDTYKLRYFPESDKYYGSRIFIPVIHNGKTVTYTARSFSDSHPRYKNASIKASSMRTKSVLYNYDLAKAHDRAFLLEGVTDVWRMGTDSMSVFRSALSGEQRNLILRAGFKQLDIIFDPKATARAYSAAENLSPFIKTIKVIRLEGEKDVADLDREYILKKSGLAPKFRG
jgi:DNA primase